ncbi:hypothetical protein ASE67_13800 [Sphingomonas sp. Leaf23]|uniref:hypothetical protein n=1 Tax=Sphingomonas sp. Leaf23 TaxID=1735689 RepID=UPI0006FC5EBC|nr:hypothetical protein [Sphingomonas sp. Leaf23]KQM85473.1 hypothetical protein ASE67_13800 [Sphingomonas sp. Leaf23]
MPHHPDPAHGRNARALNASERLPGRCPRRAGSVSRHLPRLGTRPDPWLAGALVDRIKAKRALLVVAALLPVVVAAIMRGRYDAAFLLPAGIAALGLALLW